MPLRFDRQAPITYTSYIHPPRKDTAMLNGHLLICDDCTIAAVNDDYTGMDEATEARVRAGLERTGHLYLASDDEGEYLRHDFSWSQCDCCGTRLGGGRYEAVTL